MGNNDHLEIAYTSMTLFQDDGTLVEEEFNKLLDIALKDGHVNDEEKRILNSILARLKDDEITYSFKQRIVEVKEKYNI